jgi:hypothetical protein
MPQLAGKEKRRSTGLRRGLLSFLLVGLLDFGRHCRVVSASRYGA